jgi:hypothetical protein
VRIPVVGYGAIVEGAGEVSGALAPPPLPAAGEPAVDAPDARFAIGAGRLERHLEYLAQGGFETPTVDDFVLDRISGALTARRVILTFDGGLESHYRILFPLLQKYKHRASFFIPAAAIGAPGGLARGELQIMAKWGMGFGILAPAAEKLLAMLPPALNDELTQPRRRLEDAIGRAVTAVAIPGRKIETTSLVRNVHDNGYRGLASCELGNHYQKDELFVISRYMVRRSSTSDEWKSVVRMTSSGPAKLAFFTRPLK